MTKMSDKVRQLIGLENILMKARRRHRECEREERQSEGPQAKRYSKLIARLSVIQRRQPPSSTLTLAWP